MVIKQTENDDYKYCILLVCEKGCKDGREKKRAIRKTQGSSESQNVFVLNCNISNTSRILGG